jgi:hypothetical protein
MTLIRSARKLAARAELELETPSVQVIAWMADSYNYFESKMSGRPGN